MYEGKFAKCTSAEQRREIVLNMSRRNQGQSIVLRDNSTAPGINRIRIMFTKKC